jgi:hypothetical protein
VEEAVRTHERLLGGVVGEADPADRGGGAPGVALVAADELAVGVDVSLLRSIDQLRIVRGAPLGSPFPRRPRRCTYTGNRLDVPAARSRLALRSFLRATSIVQRIT